MKKLLIFLLLSVSAFATTTVTGTIRTLGTTTVGSGTFVRFWLRGCGGNQPRVSGSGVIAPSQGGVYFFDIAANGSGVVSGTIYSTRDNAGTGNGDIECGGSKTAVWYGMQIFLAGKGGPEVAVVAKNGSTLDISNVTPITINPVVTAPTGDATYFRLDSGNGPVTGNSIFGEINSIVYAATSETVAQAVARLPVGGGTVVFAAGTYSSGSYNCSTPNVGLQGAGIPNFNSATVPTALTGGTIIQGPVSAQQGCDHFVVRDLGIDVGPNWVNNVNSGVAVNGLAILNAGQLVGAAQVQSPIIENVACLGYSLNAAFHCMLVENVNAAKIHNIKAIYNQHGLVIKGTNVDASNIWSRGHGTDSIIVLSNDYAPSNSVTIRGFHISDLATPGDTKGIFLQAAQNPLSYVNISDGDITGFLSWGIATSGASAPAAVTQLNISNVTMDGFSGNASALYCIDFQGFTSLVNIVNLSCANTAQGVIPVGVSAFNDVKVVGSQFVNIAGIGVELSGRSTVTGAHFTSVAGNAIQNDSGTLSECNNTFASVGAALSGSGLFSCGIATEDTIRNVAFPTGVLSTTYIGPGKAAIAGFPACASGVEGSHMVATNCNAGCVAGNACAAGGTTHCEMYCSSSPAWVETGR